MVSFAWSSTFFFGLAYFALFTALIGVIFTEAQAYVILLLPAVVLAVFGFLTL